MNSSRSRSGGWTLRIIKICLVLGLAVFLGQLGQFLVLSSRGDYSLQPFRRNVPDAKLKVLFVGDSTAVGTGAATNAQSIAGWLAQDFPQAHIDNRSRNGLKLEGLLKEFYPGLDRYDLVVMQIGANDILRFTRVFRIEQRLAILIDRAKVVGRQVVLLHSGNVGLAPIFHWPFTVIYQERSRSVREIYQRLAREKGVWYVDLFSERDQDPFGKNMNRYYSPDRLHLSGEGYRHWYERLRWTLSQAQVNLAD